MTNEVDMGGAHPAPELPGEESSRVKIFLAVQIIFLIISPLTGGFHYQVWSMLDTALLIASIGVTALVPVLESRKGRRAALRVAIAVYLAGVFDMAVNVLLSGWVGWKTIPFD